ncbi:hypothetical protein HPB50_014005 [Hyalomma asiaticum]|uniref:Uncharacterized protein n=1 Tax=Hyalomma asiaticum TaxID=266040 RepID=A0ACB7SJG7_HYAAI|nr:hypothetical protein HPB50_014005 [Hyalomma asiaticum]
MAYLTLLVVCGMPMICIEMAAGRVTQSGPIDAISKLCPLMKEWPSHRIQKTVNRRPEQTNGSASGAKPTVCGCEQPLRAATEEPFVCDRRPSCRLAGAQSRNAAALFAQHCALHIVIGLDGPLRFATIRRDRQFITTHREQSETWLAGGLETFSRSRLPFTCSPERIAEGQLFDVKEINTCA